MKIGPTFAAELAAVGLLGLPFSWSADGAITGRDALTADQAAKLDAVLAAHDPAKALPRMLGAYEVQGALDDLGKLDAVDAAATAARATKRRDYLYWSKNDRYVEDNPKLARLFKAASVDPKALFDKASGG